LQTVPHLVQQDVLVLLRRLPIADVAGDLRGAHDPAIPTDYRRDAERDVELAPVFLLAHGLVMIDPLATPDTLKDLRLLIPPVRWNQERHRFPDSLLLGIAKQALRPGIPACDDPVQILGNDGFVGGFD